LRASTVIAAPAARSTIAAPWRTLPVPIAIARRTIGVAIAPIAIPIGATPIARTTITGASIAGASIPWTTVSRPSGTRTVAPAAFPIAALAVIPAVTSTATIIDIIAVARIIEAVIPAIAAGIIARAIIGIVIVVPIIAIAIIAAADADAAIAITIIIAATEHQCARKAHGRQKPMSDARHRLSPQIILCPA
jgi:hypothetical protein